MADAKCPHHQQYQVLQVHRVTQVTQVRVRCLPLPHQKQLIVHVVQQIITLPMIPKQSTDTNKEIFNIVFTVIIHENGALAENVFLDSYADTLALIAVAGMAVMSCLGCFAIFGDFAAIAGLTVKGQNAKHRSDMYGCCCSVCILITLLISGVVGFFSTVFEQKCFTPWAHTMMKNTEDLTWAVTFGAIQLLLLLVFKNCMNLIVMPRLFKQLGTRAASEGLSRMFGCLR